MNSMDNFADHHFADFRHLPRQGVFEVQGRHRHAAASRNVADAETAAKSTVTGIAHESPLDLKHG